VKPKTFMLIAGEASGDFLAAELAAASTISNVPPLQGGNTFTRTFSWGFTPSYHIAGLRPETETETVKRLAKPTDRSCHVWLSRSSTIRHATGLKARQVTARAKGPGSPCTNNSQAL
jgi:hypothetical protein